MKISSYEGGVCFCCVKRGYSKICSYWGVTILVSVDAARGKNGEHQMGQVAWTSVLLCKTLERLKAMGIVAVGQSVIVYRPTEWKLFLGTYQTDQLFLELDGVAALNSFDAAKWDVGLGRN